MSIQYKNSDILSISNISGLFSLSNIIDNQIVQTMGYSTEGVGANLYRYDAGSSATIDGGFVLPGVGGALSFSGTTFNGTAGTGRFIAIDQTQADVTKFGALGDGITDDSSKIQLAFAASINILFPPKTYLLGSPVSISSINNITVQGFGATLHETSGALTSMLSFTLCNNLSIYGLKFTSGEDNTYFQANSPTEIRTQLFLQQCTDADISHVSGSNKRRFIYNYLSDGTKISNFEFTGFFPATSGGAIANTNVCPAIHLKGGSYNNVSQGTVKYHGSIVLVELTSLHLAISNLTGEELYDNGVYISSAAYSTVSNCSIRNCLGDGIKARGTNLIVQGCSGYNLRAVVHVSGINPADSMGAGGWGHIITGNTAYDCERVVYVTEANNLYCRDVTVTGNSSIASNLTGAVGAIEIITNVGNVTCTGNTVQGVAGNNGIVITHPGSLTSGGWTADAGADTLTKTDHAWYDGTQVTLTSTGTLPTGLSLSTTYYIVNATANTIQLSLSFGGAAVDLTDAGTGTTTLNTLTANCKNIVCSNNTITDVTGSASTAYGGLKLYKCDNAAVSGNSFDNLASNIAVKLVSCSGGAVTGNVYTDGYLARFPSGDSVVGVMIDGNYGNGIYVEGDKCVIGTNYILANGITGFPATSTVPLSIGQITYAGGAAYISVGVSSSGDWKQITV